MNAYQATRALLLTLAGGRVYPDVAPDAPQLPYITFQQVGGEVLNFLDRTLPSKLNARMQVNVWAATRLEACALAQQVEELFQLSLTLQASPLGAAVADFEEVGKLYGFRQDFSVWVDR